MIITKGCKVCSTCKIEKKENEFPQLKYQRKGITVRSVNCTPCYDRAMTNMRNSRGFTERIIVKSPDVKWGARASDESIDRYINNLEACVR